MENIGVSLLNHAAPTVKRRPRLELSERRLMLRTGDFLCVLGGIYIGLVAWTQRAALVVDMDLIRQQSAWMVTVAGAWLMWLAITDLYELRLAVQLRKVAPRLLAGCAAIGIIYVIYFFITAVPLAGSLVTTPIPPLRLAPAVGNFLVLVLLMLWRLLYAIVWGAPHLRRRVLIVGAGAAGSALASVLRDHSHIEPVGFVDDDRLKQGTSVEGYPILGDREDLPALVGRLAVDEIVIAISAGVDGTLFQSIMDCHERGVNVTPMPLLYEQVTGRVAVDHIGSQWYVALPFAPSSATTIKRIAKRMIDLFFGFVFGIVLLALLIPIALLIKLDSKGKVFYKQERVGVSGKPFMVIKFRSMREDAERDGQARWAIKGDDRVTRIGRFLRRTRLDELPQIINVLKGEMSIVGPRPERQQFINDLQRQIPFYRTRLAAKPGLTGWAQVNYGYGATVEDALIKLQYDLYYLKHQSPLFDLNIILRTIAVVLKMKGQ